MTSSKKSKKPATRRRGADTDEQPAAGECFVIMPFGGWFDEYYDAIYRPAIRASGLEPRRADDLYRPSAIVHDIWTYTKRCRLVLADLTGKNPNVFYELGLAHAITKPAILVTESINDVPFDLRALRVLEYDKNAPGWGEILRGKIESSIAEILVSPLQAVLPSFLEVDETKKASVSVHEKELLEIRQELDLLRQEIRRDRTTPQVDGPAQVRSVRQIRDMMHAGMSDDGIVKRMEREGVDPALTRTYVSTLRRLDRAREAVRTREASARVAKVGTDESSEPKAG